jgi:poly(A) polymerase
MAKKRLKALRFDHQIVNDVSTLIELHLRFHGYVDEPWTDSAVRRYVADSGPLYSRLNRLTRADATTQNKRKSLMFDHAMDEMEARVTELKKKEDLESIRPDINGSQIMELLGVQPGPIVGKAYTHMLEYRMENGEVGYDAAVAELKKWWSEQAGARTDAQTGEHE